MKASQVSQQNTIGGHAGLLRAWHLAILRFALTRENADRLGVLAIANEIDRLGRGDVGSAFSFFRRTSAELCGAMLRQREGDDIVLSRYLAQIDDARLHQALAAALDRPRQPALVISRSGPNQGLWRGLPSRGISRA